MDGLSQSNKIYRAIKDSGDRGVENWKLARIALNYTMRISELRKDGHVVIAERVYANGRWTGTYRYHLGDEPAKKIRFADKLKSLLTEAWYRECVGSVAVRFRSTILFRQYAQSVHQKSTLNQPNP